MISAFGVEHSIEKSLVGGVFKPASALTRAERGTVGGYRQAKRIGWQDRQFKSQVGQIKTMHSNAKPSKTIKGKSGTTHVYRHGDHIPGFPENVAGFHVRQGGKKGTSHVHYKTKGTPAGGMKPKETLAHEMAHARPARSVYRSQQIGMSAKKTMREEARADFESHGHFRMNPKSGYAQAATFRRKAVKGQKSEAKAKRVFRKVPVVGEHLGQAASSTVRTAGLPTRAKQTRTLENLSSGMNKPIGNKEVDAYIKTQDRMARARGITLPKDQPRMTRKQQAVAGGVAATGAAGAGAVAVRNRKKKPHG